jgi:anti-anti-sigma factor
MSVSKPGLFTVRSDSTGALVLTGELDVATIQGLQDKIDESMVPGQPIVLDLADLTFLDTSGMHCFVRTFEATGHPVVLLNASRSLRRILGHMTQEPEACFRRRDCVLRGELVARAELATLEASIFRAVNDLPQGLHVGVAPSCSTARSSRSRPWP